MRVIIQRVRAASVEVEGQTISKISKGLLVLAGIESEDTTEDLQWIANKIAHLRIFDDENKIPNLSVMETGGSILVVSQFTLHASTKKGNRPGYSKAAAGQVAEPLLNDFIAMLKTLTGSAIGRGKFGADMQVSLVNDGPLTIMIDSKLRE